MARAYTPQRLHVCGDPSAWPLRSPPEMRAAWLAFVVVVLLAGCGGGSSAGPESPERSNARSSVDRQRGRTDLEDLGLIVLHDADTSLIVDCEGPAFFTWWARVGSGENDGWAHRGPQRDARTTCAAALQWVGSAPPRQRLGTSCPQEWPGPWTACPEAAWVAAILGRSGFAVTDETGSALVAGGSGWSFGIWSTEIGDSLAGREQWRPLGRRAGVLVYGDRDLWRWWAAQGFVIWVHAGPYADSRAPDLDGLAALIRASREITPP